MSVSGKGICTKPAITNLSGAHEQGHPRRRGLMPQSWPGRLQEGTNSWLQAILPTPGCKKICSTLVLTCELAVFHVLPTHGL
ncbi:hypothetical protein SORBI_3008G061701 [Sorghum bicolor]|uniref:Uncharacterized protein n=1 Tax=Sorghum bicolor TaxID=4558 RepID=A0A1Z5R555_SORBI|nr:hypothetical protein SORBI_3008G061701 [Sorghum bicolor]